MEDQRPPSRKGGEGKGKGKSRDDEPPPPQPTQENSSTPAGSSVFTRIARSAAGLGRDVVNARPGAQDVGSLAAVASTNKAAAAGPSAAALREAGLSSASSLAADNRLRAGGPSSSSSSGTSAAVQQHVSMQEAEFSQFLDGIPADLSTEPIVGLDDSLDASNGSSNSFAVPATPAQAQYHPHSAPAQRPHSDVAEQERRDGLDVVNLLAAGGPQEEEPDYADIELAEDEADALRNILFGGSGGSSSSAAATQQPAWDHVLNFIPDFVRPNAGDTYEQQAQQELTPGPKSHATQAVLGLGHTPETTRVWLNQWHDVLTRYDDEVWGGLAPLVQEARTEVDRLSAAKPDAAAALGGSTALDRLRQILGHLRDGGGR